jgi:glycosyltransferase involved in cell wall biosynthesis
MKPVISVLMPIYNNAGTLSLALASLRAQTFADWECVIVDDGSFDHPEETLARYEDARIRYIRFPENRGRGTARQAALTAAEGKFIAFLDGDDWLFPHKLERQMKAFETHPNAVVVSAAMAIVSTQNALVAVRGPGNDVVGTARVPSQMSVPFAPSMVRTDVAKAVGFDPKFPIAEDADFMVGVLLGREYVLLSEPLYTYTEHSSVTFEKVSLAFDYCNVLQRKYAASYPASVRSEIRKNNAKKFAYWLAKSFGAWEYMIRRRSVPATQDQHRSYEAAWNVVRTAAERPAPISA